MVSLPTTSHIIKALYGTAATNEQIDVTEIVQNLVKIGDFCASNTNFPDRIINHKGKTLDIEYV